MADDGAGPGGLDPDTITALVEVLNRMMPSTANSTALNPPTFDWNSSDQYDDFQLFCKSVNSWFTLQKIPAETVVGGSTVDTRLQYVLNFLGNMGRRKYDRWKPAGTPEEVKIKKTSAKEFLDHLASTMDHAISQRCRIYQLEEVRIRSGESPDELVERLRALADRCDFPSEEEKERQVQYRLVRALTDRELVRKLLAMDIKATTAQMLDKCRTHIAISNNMDQMGLGSSKSVNAIRRQGPKPKQETTKGPKKQHSCGNCTKDHAPGRTSCPAKDSVCRACDRVGHWKVKCRTSKRNAGDKPRGDKPRGDRRNPKSTKKIAEVGTDIDAYCDEVCIATLNAVGVGPAVALNEVGAAADPCSAHSSDE